MLSLSALAFAAVLISQTSTEAPTVGLAVQPAVGLSDEEAKAVQQKITDELTAVGLLVVAADPVDASCVPDPACVEGVRSGAAEPRSSLLVVEMVRLGPVLQLTATGASAAAQVTASQSIDEKQLAEGPILPEDVRGWARTLLPKKAPPPPPKKKDKELALTPMQIGAGAAAGVGAVALLAGVVLVGVNEGVLEDKTSSGADKESAATMGWVGLAASVIGVAAIGTGAALFLLE